MLSADPGAADFERAFPLALVEDTQVEVARKKLSCLKGLISTWKVGRVARNGISFS